MQIYVYRNNQQIGPFTEAEIRAQFAANVISLHDNVWWQGLPNWMPLGQSPLSSSLLVPGTAAAAAYHPNYIKTSNLALWSMICGISGFFCGITCIPAIILGHMGLSDTKRNPALQGRGMAIAGLILGYCCLAFLIVYISIVSISVLIALGNQVKSVNQQVQSKADDAQNSYDSTNSDQSTNSPDQSVTPASSDSPDSSTNSATPVTP